MAYNFSEPSALQHPMGITRWIPPAPAPPVDETHIMLSPMLHSAEVCRCMQTAPPAPFQTARGRRGRMVECQKGRQTAGGIQLGLNPDHWALQRVHC